MTKATIRKSVDCWFNLVWPLIRRAVSGMSFVLDTIFSICQHIVYLQQKAKIRFPYLVSFRAYTGTRVVGVHRHFYSADERF